MTLSVLCQAINIGQLFPAKRCNEYNQTCMQHRENAGIDSCGNVQAAEQEMEEYLKKMGVPSSSLDRWATNYLAHLTLSMQLNCQLNAIAIADWDAIAIVIAIAIDVSVAVQRVCDEQSSHYAIKPSTQQP